MKLIYRCLCMVLGAILGSGCSDSTDPVEYGPMPEYGVPTGAILLDGRVINDIGAPIPGIQVSYYGAGIDTTDADGKWAIEHSQTYIPCADGGQSACQLEAKDIDGPVNGGPYPPALVTLDLTQTEPGNGGYDLGTWEQHGIEVLMTDAAEYGPPVAGAKGSKPPAGSKR